MIDKRLLEILACPACKSDIQYNEARNVIICTKCKRVYPVKDGIPVMLIEESVQE